MADEVKIDKEAFQERLLSFVSIWKAEKRSGDALFAGVGSLVILMGRNEEAPNFQKKNAMHVRLSSLRCFRER
jgi:nucleosome binding factor SPN SPT16 subunit